MNDCVVIGGGAVGLSIAYELSRHDWQVQLVERNQCGQEASWAGAGILPATSDKPGTEAYQRLAQVSAELHARWADELRNETGIDTGYHRCGELFLEEEEIPGEPLSRSRLALESRGVQVELMDRHRIGQIEPNLAVTEKEIANGAVYHTPGSAQIRNPRYLQSLKEACRQRGVQITEGADVLGFDSQGESISSVQTTAGNFSAAHFCLAAGAWTTPLAEMLGFTLPVKPIRGQMVLLRGDQRVIERIIHQGSHYLVPRPDGRVLVGSTLEDVGFEKKTTISAIGALLRFAQNRVPALALAEVERCWAGFRPASPDGYPYIGAVPGFTNGWVAAGHYRWGLFLSPATAVLARELMQGETPSVAHDDFRIARTTAAVG